MTAVHAILGVALTVLFGVAGLLGAWRWWRAQDSRGFWRALRLAQGLVVVQAVLGGALLLAGRRPVAADTVLAARGMSSSAEVGSLPAAEQQSLVRGILQRELGVMCLGAVVAFGLCIRAGLT